MSKELPRHETRLKMTFIRQKTDPSKIFVFAHTDHAIADGLGLMQTFANLQDNREGNCVPCPNYLKVNLDDTKYGDVKKLIGTVIMEFLLKWVSETNQLGLDAKSKNNTRNYFISDDIRLGALLLKALPNRLGINDLFFGACITAWSKLDLPVESKPSQFNCFMASSLWSSK